MSLASLASGLPLAELPSVVHASWAMYILTALLLGPTLYFIFAARRGKDLYIRRIPGIDAIEEAIGRATELGRPMMFTTGLTGLVPLLYALLGILRHVARKAAAYGCRLIVPQSDYEVLPIVEETVREAYRSVGKVDQFNPRDVRFLSTNQFAFASGFMGIAHREQAASCFLFGAFAAESLILAEAGQQVGAMQVAGTDSYTQVPFFLTSCDYTIIGEEVYAAGAYLSREPAQLGSVRGQDVAKLVVLATVLIGTIWATWISFNKKDYREAVEGNTPFARMLYVLPEQKKLLPRINFEDSYKPPDIPPQADVEVKLASSRRKLARSGRDAARKLAGIAGLAAEEEKNLRDQLDLFPAAGRAEAEAAANALKNLAESLGRETTVSTGAIPDGEKEPLADLLEKQLPELETACREKARQRAAEYFAPELDCLEYWASLQKSDPDCGAGGSVPELIEAARKTAADEASTPEAIALTFGRARDACHQKYFDLVRVQFREAKNAADEKTPGYLLRTDEGLKGAREAATKDKVASYKEYRNAPTRIRTKASPLRTVHDWNREARLKSRILRSLFEAAKDRLDALNPTVLVLDGTKSVSGRGRPLALSHEWVVVRLPDEEPEGSPSRPQARMTFSQPGDYEVRLTVSEKQASKRMILSVDTTDPTVVEYQRLPAGTELVVSWRLPKKVVPNSEKITFAFRDEIDDKESSDYKDSTFTVDGNTLDEDSIIHFTYAQPGNYVMTITALCQVEKAGDGGASAREAAAAEAAADANEALIALRDRLGMTLRELTNRLGKVNGDLAELAKESEKYHDGLKERKGLTAENWPDRVLAKLLTEKAGELGKLATEKANFLGPKAGAAETFGSGKSPDEETPAGGAAGPGEQDKGPEEDKEKETEEVWKRYRIYWTVLEPLEASTRTKVQIREAPIRPPAPWDEIPQPEPVVDAAAEGGGE